MSTVSESSRQTPREMLWDYYLPCGQQLMTKSRPHMFGSGQLNSACLHDETYSAAYCFARNRSRFGAMVRLDYNSENVGYKKNLHKSAVIFCQRSGSGWWSSHLHPYFSLYRLEIFDSQNQSFEMTIAKRILPILGTLTLFLSTTSAAVDCNTTDTEAFYDASCWASLDLTRWYKSLN